MSVEVTSWADFVTAVGTSGADVVIPAETVWDMNEILPHYNQNLVINCDSINGNGAEIKNLHITGFFEVNSAVSISNITFSNILADGSGADTVTYENGFFNSRANGITSLHGVTASGIFGSGYSAIFAVQGAQGKYWDVTQSAFNFDMQNGSRVCSDYVQGVSLYACRVFVDFPSASTVRIGGLHSPTFTEFVINAPLAEQIDAYGISSCTIRGNLQNVQEIKCEVPEGEVSVYSTESAPDAVINGGTWGTQLVGVTDAQFKSAEYLRSIGFIIGVS
jgi:hypothetical protein